MTVLNKLREGAQTSQRVMRKVWAEGNFISQKTNSWVFTKLYVKIKKCI